MISHRAVRDFMPLISNLNAKKASLIAVFFRFVYMSLSVDMNRRQGTDTRGGILWSERSSDRIVRRNDCDTVKESIFLACVFGTRLAPRIVVEIHRFTTRVAQWAASKQEMHVTQ